jgi:pimeloyl-ACP methyl ester carboxylesterase
LIDTGAGPAIVLIPGIQGRWEWMTPAIDALASRYRVFSFSLSDLPAGQESFDGWMAMIDRVLDAGGVQTATIVGVSFGGLVALHYAAIRSGRVDALVLVSTPSPRWRPDPRTRFYMRWPRAVMPLLAARSMARLTPEIIAARATWRDRVRLGGGYAWRALRSPLSATRMVRWVEGWFDCDIEGECRRITAPTTVITGETALDQVVPVASTLQIVELIPQARHVVFAGTGHIGCVTRPDRFVQLIDDARGGRP